MPKVITMVRTVAARLDRKWDTSRLRFDLRALQERLGLRRLEGGLLLLLHG